MVFIYYRFGGLTVKTIWLGQNNLGSTPSQINYYCCKNHGYEQFFEILQFF